MNFFEKTKTYLNLSTNVATFVSINQGRISYSFEDSYLFNP